MTLQNRLTKAARRSLSSLREMFGLTETTPRRRPLGRLPRTIQFNLECLEDRVVPVVGLGAITLSGLPADTVGVYYDQNITATGGSGPITLKVTNIQNPISGLNVPTSGTGSLNITGTPTAAGSETFTVTATDTAGDTTTGTYSTSTTINFNSGSLTHLPDADLDAYTSYTQSGFSVTPDVAVDGAGAHEHINSTGMFTHIHDDEPGGPGVIIVQRTDGGAFMLDSLNVPEIYTGTNPDFSVGSLTFTDSKGDTYTTSATGALNPNWGPITWFTITPNNILDSQGGMGYVNDIVVSSLSNYTLTVNPVASLSPAPLPAATAGALYNPDGNPTVTITAGGTGQVNMSVSNIQGPNLGLTIQTLAQGTDGNLNSYSLDSSTASLANVGPGLIITGTPTATGTDTFTVTATDALGVTTTTTYSITTLASGYSYAAYTNSFDAYISAYNAYKAGQGSYAALSDAYISFYYAYYAYYDASTGDTGDSYTNAYYAYYYGYVAAYDASVYYAATGSATAWNAYYYAYLDYDYSLQTALGN
jgi:hypothetical protein